VKVKAISKGVAKGILWTLPEGVRAVKKGLEDPALAEKEASEFHRGRKKALKNLEALIEKTRQELGEEEAEIFEGHYELLDSEDVIQEVEERILKQLMNAVEAVLDFAETNALEMEALEDEYFRARGQDFRDLGQQLVRAMGEGDSEIPPLPEEAIVVAHELTPSQTAGLDFGRVKGFLLHQGGQNSHGAILARGYNIPALVVTDPQEFALLSPGKLVLLDGDSGEVHVDPPEEKIQAFSQRIRKQSLLQEEMKKVLPLPAVTADGQRLAIYSNVGDLKGVDKAVENHAEGIGLFRTEFLFMQASSMPSQEQQESLYGKAIKKMGGRNIIFRLLDTGADKPLPYLTMKEEENPFLGLRGIRLLLEHPEIIDQQLTALLRASQEGPVLAMIPMIAGLEGLRKVKARVEALALKEALTDVSNFQLGVMVETPAAVIMIDEIIAEADFVSIGTNDLTQYTLAADRGNPDLSLYYDEYHPAVLRSIARVVTQVKGAGKLAGVCGELAGDYRMLPFFVGIGLEEISVSPLKVGELKYWLRKIESSAARVLTQKILTMATSQEIKDVLEQYFAVLSEEA